MDCQYSFVIMQQIICGFCGQGNENVFFSRYGMAFPPRQGVAVTKMRMSDGDASVLVTKMREDDLAIVTKDQAHEL